MIVNSIILWGSMIALILLGCPITFALGSVSCIAAMFVWGGISGLYIIASTAAEVTVSWVLLAIPLFVFMAKILELSGITDELFDAMYMWMGRLAGGLAIGTTAIGVILGAMMGAAPASTATMAGLSVEPMLKRGYDKKIIAGSIASSGALSIIIPPSILMLVYASLTGLSPGALFLGGIMPGLLIGLLFSLYIFTRCTLNPNLGPKLVEAHTWKAKIGSLRPVVLAVIIVGVVLGSIYLGFATPTEAAAVGAFTSLLLAFWKRKLGWGDLAGAIQETMRITCFILWIVISASVFMRVVSAMGTSELIYGLFGKISIWPILVLAIIQAILILLGCVLDPLGIMLITLPVFAPVAIMLGFNPLWFAIIFIVNLATSFVTPPFGLNLFVVKGMVKQKIGMGQIIQGAFPFFLLYLVGIVVLIIFPGLATWLPSLM